MKKIHLWLLTVLVLASVMSCISPVNETPPVSFYGEIGRISTSDYNNVAATIPAKTTYTFAEISNYRWQFRSKTQYDFSSAPGGTRTNIYDLLTTKGYSPNEANTTIDNIIQNGNGLLFFTYAYSTDYMIWMYIETE